MDPRIQKLAAQLVHDSIKVKKGSLIEIRGNNEAKDLINEIAKLILLKGAFPVIHADVEGTAYTYYKYASEEQLKAKPKLGLLEAKMFDGYIGIGAPLNTKELTSIDPGKIALRSKVTRMISDITLKKDNWVICEFPTNALAQDAEMSLPEFEDFVYSACLIDWKNQAKIQNRLKKVLDKGKEAHIVGEDTDIYLDIRGRTGQVCLGSRNMPDGEVFLAPVETKTHGYIHYDFPVSAYGKEIDDIRLEFKKGKVVKATASKNQDFLRKMIKVDKGACMLGELGIGTNFGIKRFIKQILFDEKIGGTVHLALGMAYKVGGGKNHSALHWDMIKDLRKGGAVYVDGKCIQRNGKFLI
ncbi:MAG TPA: aminopeptidase [Candidatus Nanoarchaeia archaeon]|nr:aminopeptidase [Candidatus Nanoarchaeia archaeon]